MIKYILSKYKKMQRSVIRLSKIVAYLAEALANKTGNQSVAGTFHLDPTRKDLWGKNNLANILVKIPDVELAEPHNSQDKIFVKRKGSQAKELVPTERLRKETQRLAAQGALRH